MSEDERSILESYLTGFQKQFGNYTSKYYQLYKLLSDISGEVDEDDVRRRISPNGSLESFQKLCARFKEKLFDSLLMDFNIKRRPNPYSRPAQILFRIRKQLSIAQILYGRGFTSDAKAIIEKSYKDCCAYNHFQEATSFLYLLYAIENRLGKQKRVLELEKEIQHIKGVRDVTETSEAFFNSIVFREYYQGNPETYVSEIKQKLEILENNTYLSSSKQAVYFYQYLYTRYFKIRKDYEKMDFHARETLHVLMQNPKIQSKPRMINSYLLLVDANVHNRRFSLALDYTDRALLELVPGNKNYDDIQIQKAQICIYAGLYNQANSIIQGLISMSNTARPKNLVPFDKLLYYQSTISFLNRKFSEAHKAASQIGSFTQDKEGWNINSRILRVMIMIENNYLDEADQEIENFRRSLTNIMKAHPVSKRNILIFRMLAWLSKKDFDFARVYKEHNKLWQLLASDDPELRWDFLTPEIIPFHTWMENRALKRKADDNFYTPKTAEPALPQPSGQVLNN